MLDLGAQPTGNPGSTAANRIDNVTPNMLCPNKSQGVTDFVPWLYIEIFRNEAPENHGSVIACDQSIVVHWQIQ